MVGVESQASGASYTEESECVTTGNSTGGVRQVNQLEIKVSVTGTRPGRQRASKNQIRLEQIIQRLSDETSSLSDTGSDLQGWRGEHEEMANENG